MIPRSSAAADRNKGPILEVLRRELPAAGKVLELASGTGQHVVHFAEHLPDLVFQPSDPSAEARADVEARRVASGLANVLPPVAVDVLVPGWEEPFVDALDALVCINMVQVAPPAASRALFEGASRALRAGAPLVLYSPLCFGGVFRAESNAAFDASLRERNPDWGVRDGEVLAAEARERGLSVGEPIEMPAQNHVIVFRRAGGGDPRKTRIDTPAGRD